MRDYGLTKICRAHDIIFVDSSAVCFLDNRSQGERIEQGITCEKEATSLIEQITFWRNFDHQMKKNRNLLFTKKIVDEFEKGLSRLPYFDNPTRSWIKFVRINKKLKRDSARLFLFQPDDDERRDIRVMSELFSEAASELKLSDTDYDLVITANTLAGYGGYIGILSYDFSLLAASQRVASYLGHEQRVTGYFFQKGIFVPSIMEKHRPRKKVACSFPSLERERKQKTYQAIRS